MRVLPPGSQRRRQHVPGLRRAEDYFKRRGDITDADLGLYNVTGNDEDRHSFKVPSLRMAAHTAPYLHDGTAETLRDAVDAMFEFQLGARRPTKTRTPSLPSSRRWRENLRRCRNETWRTDSRCRRDRHPAGSGWRSLHDGQRRRRAVLPQLHRHGPADPAALLRLEHRTRAGQVRSSRGLRFAGCVHTPHVPPQDGSVRDRPQHSRSSRSARQLHQRLCQRDRRKGGTRRAIQDRLRGRAQFDPLSASRGQERGAAGRTAWRPGSGTGHLSPDPADGSLSGHAHRRSPGPSQTQNGIAPRNQRPLSAHLGQHALQSFLPRGRAAH